MFLSWTPAARSPASDRMSHGVTSAGRCELDTAVSSRQQASGFHGAEYSPEMLFFFSFFFEALHLASLRQSRVIWRGTFSAAGRYKRGCKYFHTDTFDPSEMIVLAEARRQVSGDTELTKCFCCISEWRCSATVIPHPSSKQQFMDALQMNASERSDRRSDGLRNPRSSTHTGSGFAQRLEGKTFVSPSNIWFA